MGICEQRGYHTLWYGTVLQLRTAGKLCKVGCCRVKGVPRNLRSANANTCMHTHTRRVTRSPILSQRRVCSGRKQYLGVHMLLYWPAHSKTFTSTCRWTSAGPLPPVLEGMSLLLLEPCFHRAYEQCARSLPPCRKLLTGRCMRASQSRRVTGLHGTWRHAPHVDGQVQACPLKPGTVGGPHPWRNYICSCGTVPLEGRVVPCGRGHSRTSCLQMTRP